MSPAIWLVRPYTWALSEGSSGSCRYHLHLFFDERELGVAYAYVTLGSAVSQARALRAVLQVKLQPASHSYPGADHRRAPGSCAAVPGRLLRPAGLAVVRPALALGLDLQLGSLLQSATLHTPEPPT